MPLHQSILPNRRQAIVLHSTSRPCQFNYMFGIAVKLASRKTPPDVDIYFMTDDTRKDLIESTPGLKFLSLGPISDVQCDLSTLVPNVRSPPRDPRAVARFLKDLWQDPQINITCIERCHRYLRELRPMLVLLDQFSRALDCAMALKIPYLMCGNQVVPTTKPSDRSALSAFFTIPSMCSGFVGPMTWYQTWQNCTNLVQFFILILLSPTMHAQARNRRTLLSEPNLPFAPPDRSYGSDLEHGEIWAMPPSILHPHTKYATVFPVGPTFAAQFEENVKTNLNEWLCEGPVIYISMGTSFKYTDADLHVFASTLRDLVQPTSNPSFSSSLITHNKHRFLWKLPRASSSRLTQLYRTFLDASETYGRVRIEDWIDYPHAVLQHRNVLAFVHHGGANSFVEAGWCGVPQVVLPQWADCYDTAAQAERLGLGVSNKDDLDVPYLSVPVLTKLLGTLLASEGTSARSAFPKSLHASQGYEWYKQNAERFAAECRLAGGATRASQIIEEAYAKELTEWDGSATTGRGVSKA